MKKISFFPTLEHQSIIGLNGFKLLYITVIKLTENEDDVGPMCRECGVAAYPGTYVASSLIRHTAVSLLFTHVCSLT